MVKYFPTEPRIYIKMPGTKNKRYRTFLINPTKIQQPKLMHLLAKALEKTRVINDFNGDQSNFGEILKHLEAKGFDCSEARERFIAPAEDKIIESFFNGQSYQKGNNE